MRQALAEARKAYESGEVPIGAILVIEGKVVARGFNQVELLQDATAHAEMLCVTSASAALGQWRLKGATLYSTVEPCSMCLGAMLLSRIDRLVWGAPDIRHGANGSWVDLLAHRHPTHELEVTQDCLKGECAELLVRFFKERRLQKERERDESEDAEDT
jgi:tRNA(adenine34) deaminase